jgi:hypothetical protein
MNNVVIPIIQKSSSPNFPQFEFEWHENDGKVYVGHVPGSWEDDVFVPGEMGNLKFKILAEHCDTHARFLGFVQTYLRGYRQCESDTASKLKKQSLKLVRNE